MQGFLNKLKINCAKAIDLFSKRIPVLNINDTHMFSLICISACLAREARRELHKITNRIKSQIFEH